MRFRRDVQDALRWRAAAARARLRNGLNLLGWQRDQRVAISAGPELPVVFCTWQRLERLDGALAQLAAQTIPVQAVIWNNSPQRRLVELKAAAARVRTTVHHSPRNIGGFGRFYLARELAETGHEAVIFIDDDQDFPLTMASDLVAQHRSRSIGGWWAYRFASDDYFDRERVEVGERASYIGTSGMISDTAVFSDPQVFQCPRRFWFVEDLWLSFVASKLHGWNLSRSAVDFTEVPDGLDQFLRLGNTKTRFLRYLIRQGWDVGAEAGEPETAGKDVGAPAVRASEAS